MLKKSPQLSSTSPRYSTRRHIVQAMATSRITIDEGLMAKQAKEDERRGLAKVEEHKVADKNSATATKIFPIMTLPAEI